MAICLVVQKCRHYLLGRHFIAKTDQQSLRFIMQQYEVGVEYQKWVTKLLGYSFDVQFKPCSSNRITDVLSQKIGGEINFRSLLSQTEIDWTQLDVEVNHDPLL